MKIRVRFIVLCGLLSNYFAANGKVAGIVKDINGDKLSGASVMLVSMPDGTLVASVLADADGRFEFTDEDEDDRILIAEFPGYKEGRCVAGPDCEMVLEESVTSLNEVVVEAKGNDVRAEGGKFKFLPGAVARKMPTAFDAISISPLIKKDESGQLSIFYNETPATIYINGKKPREQRENVLAMLRTIPPENIIRIEVWPNPGLADPDSKGGIINVEIRNPNDGVMGSIGFNGALNFGRVSSGLTSYTSFQKGKLHSSLLVQYAGNNNRTEEETNYRFKISEKEVSDRVENSSYRNEVLANYYISYDLTGKSQIGGGVGIAGCESHSHFRIKNINFLEDENYSVGHSLINENSPLYLSHLGGYLFYNLQLDHRRSYFEIMTSGYILPEHSTNRFLNMENMSDVEKSRLERGGFSVSSKLSKNYERAGNLMVNAELNRYRDKDRHELNMMLDDDFKAMKTFATVSANYSISLGLLTLSAGVKGNFNRIEVRQGVTEQIIRNNYFRIYPSASVNYSFRGMRSSLSLAYSASERLPGFNSMNPRRIVVSDNLVREGNPYLKPMTSHSLNLMYMINPNIFITINGTKGKTNYSRYFSENEIMVVKNETGGKSEEVAVSPYYQNTFFDIWTLNAYLSVTYTHLKNKNDASGNFSYWRPTASVNNTVEFIPGKRWFMTCGYMFRGKTRYFYTDFGALHSILLNFRKSFPSGLDLSIDLSRSFNSKGDYYFDAETYSYAVRQRKTITLTLSASYTFGNRRVSGATTRQIKNVD